MTELVLNEPRKSARKKYVSLGRTAYDCPRKLLSDANEFKDLNPIVCVLGLGWGHGSNILCEVLCCPHASDFMADAFSVANFVVLDALWRGCEFCRFHEPNPASSQVGRNLSPV